MNIKHTITVYTSRAGFTYCKGCGWPVHEVWGRRKDGWATMYYRHHHVVQPWSLKMNKRERTFRPIPADATF